MPRQQRCLDMYKFETWLDHTNKSYSNGNRRKIKLHANKPFVKRILYYKSDILIRCNIIHFDKILISNVNKGKEIINSDCCIFIISNDGIVCYGIVCTDLFISNGNMLQMQLTDNKMLPDL